MVETSSKGYMIFIHVFLYTTGVLDSRLSTDALTTLHRQCPVSRRLTDASTAGTAGTPGTDGGGSGTSHVQSRAGDTLRSLDVLSAAAALRSEMLERCLVLPGAADTLPLSSVNSCQVSRR